VNSSIPPPSLPPGRKKPRVAVFVGVACLVYAMSLPLQRALPGLKDALGLPIAEGIRPTYYLRVAMSLLAGAALAALTPGRPRSERLLAWGTAAAVVAAAAVICAVP
jgi:hypothetical protein